MLDAWSIPRVYDWRKSKGARCMLDVLAGKSPQSARVERSAHLSRAAAIGRLVLALICTVIFLCALATPYLTVLLIG